MIHQVKIKSLPQEWLWCETWCDNTSKAKAKTIDLCNNPETKEPKLQAAMRIISEWKSYDDEVRNLQKRFDDGMPPGERLAESDSDGQKSKPESKSETDQHSEL